MFAPIVLSVSAIVPISARVGLSVILIGGGWGSCCLGVVPAPTVVIVRVNCGPRGRRVSFGGSLG